MKKNIWILQTTDSLQLPLGVFDTAKELAIASGVCETTIFKTMANCKAAGRRCRYEKVEVEVEPDEIKNHGCHKGGT